MTPDLRQEILKLEKNSHLLETDAAEFKSWLSQAEIFSDRFLSSLSDQPAFSPSPDVESFLEDIPEAPSPFSSLFSRLETEVLERGLNASSGRYMAYVPGGGMPIAAIADLVAALSNRYSGNYGACPPAAEIENSCIRWLIEAVAFPSSSWGVLTSGGTLAALTGLVAARNTREPSAWNCGVIYMTSECHHSIKKALATIGLGHLPVRRVPIDSEFRMVPQELIKLVEADRLSGLSPWIVCATAGTTNTGAVDPIGAISQICKKNGLWLHVDGAYGGFFVLGNLKKMLLADMALADSLVLDPHKGLFMPYGIGAVLVRDAELLRSSFVHQPDYLQDLKLTQGLSPSDYSIESSRHFRGLRMWLALKVHGMERFRKALDEKILLAQYTEESLKQIPGIQLGPTAQLSCVTFRVVGKSDSECDALTRELLEDSQKRGIFYSSSTRLHGKLFQRICILNFRTHLKEVDESLQDVKMAMQKMNGT